MYKLKFTRKFLAFFTCGILSLNAVGFYGDFICNENTAYAAMTIGEILEQRNENNKKIAALEEKLNGLEGQKNYEQKQQAYLNEQITAIQENINLLNAELETLKTDINAAESKIEVLQTNINEQQEEIKEKIALFKERLCIMYMNSTDTSASIVLGSSSFYDMMSRIYMINRIAEYDDNLIDEINRKIDKIEKSKKDVEREKLNLSMKLDEQNKRKKEKDAEIALLNEKMQLSKSETDRLARELASLERDKSVIEKEQAVLQAKEDAWNAEIKRQQEEAQRLWEEEQKKQQQSNNIVPSQPGYIPVTPSQSGFAWPVPGHSYVSSYFGLRTLHGKQSYHKGIDIADGFIMGSTCVASQSGKVIDVYNSCTHNFGKSYYCYSNNGYCGGGYGNYVLISHDGTYSTIYGHLTSASVSVGDYVSQGDIIGYIGSTGHSTGAHLHFEVRVNGVVQNPLNYVTP